MKMRILFSIFLGSLIACGDSGSGPGPDGGGGNDGPGQMDGPTGNENLTFTTETVDNNRAGLFARIASGGGNVGIAYYREVLMQDQPTITCPPSSPGGSAIDKQRPAALLYYSQWDGTGWSSPAMVDTTIGEAFGIGLAMDGNGNPHIGYLGGDVNMVECNSGDAMMATSTNGTTFTSQTVYTAHTTGDTVGHWASVAIDGSGSPQMAFRDVRFGLYEQDGNIRSSLVFGNGEDVLFEMGYGEFNKLVFDASGDPVLMTTRNDQGGDITIAHRTGGSWNAIDLIGLGAFPYPDLATDGNGNFMLAYYQPGARALEIRETSSPLAGWSPGEQIDISLTDHGRYTSVAYDNAGNPAISYYRCSSASSSGCQANEDGVRFAYRINGTWRTYNIDDGGDNPCGEYTGVAFDAQNNPMVVYQCDFFSNQLQEFVPTVKVARGAWQ